MPQIVNSHNPECMYVYVCVKKSDPWSGMSLLDWDVEVLQPATFPAPKVGVLCEGQRLGEFSVRAKDFIYMQFLD